MASREAVYFALGVWGKSALKGGVLVTSLLPQFSGIREKGG